MSHSKPRTWVELWRPSCLSRVCLAMSKSPIGSMKLWWIKILLIHSAWWPAADSSAPPTFLLPRRESFGPNSWNGFVDSVVYDKIGNGTVWRSVYTNTIRITMLSVLKTGTDFYPSTLNIFHYPSYSVNLQELSKNVSAPLEATEGLGHYRWASLGQEEGWAWRDVALNCCIGRHI